MTMREHSRSATSRRWAVPLTAVVAGLGYLVAGLVGDRPGFGVFGLVLMLVVAAAFVLVSKRSEYVDGLRSGRDERIAGHDRDASLAAGMVVLLASLVMFMVEIARGEDGSPYYQLAALGGVTYVATLGVLRFTR
jgi:hypothetical protein